MIANSCNVKSALLLEYQQGTETYANMVNSLVHLIGTAPISEYEIASEKAETFRLLTHEIRKRLDSHVAEHGC
jgi:hypothetical protein